MSHAELVPCGCAEARLVVGCACECHRRDFKRAELARIADLTEAAIEHR